jgi:DNA-binding CsgD family transcriptional regulator
VRFLGRRIAGSNILLVVTARTDEAGGRAQIRRALAEIPPAHVKRIEVPLLSEEAVVSLAGEHTGPALFRVTGGNAFFVSELLGAGSGDEPPTSLRDAVLMRADRLSRKARQMLDAVSIFPRRVESNVIDAICGGDHLVHSEDCVAQGLLAAGGGFYAFRHEIARRAVELALKPSQRRDLNARALAALRETTGAALARLVHHANEAGDSAAVRELAPVAGEQASRVGAHREAAELFRTALLHANTFALSERLALLEQFSFECHLIGEMDQAIACQTSALELHRASGNRVREGDCLRWLSRLSYLAGNRVAADRYAKEAIDILADLPSGPELAMAYSNLSHLAMLADRPDEALDHGQKAIALAEPDALDRPDILCHALNNVGCSARFGNPDHGRSLLDRSLATALSLDYPEHAARTYTNRAWFEFNQLDDDQAALFFDVGIAYCVERDLDTWRDYMRGWHAQLQLRHGCWDEAASMALRVLGNESATPLMRYPAVLALAKLRTRRGDPAGELLDELARFLETGMELQRFAPYAALVAERAWLGQAEMDLALRLLDEAQALAADPGMVPEVLCWQKMLDPARRKAPTSDMPRVYQLLLAGEWRLAADAWQKQGAPFEQALALFGGDHRSQCEALGIFDQLGATAAAERARTLIRQRGGRIPNVGPRASTRANAAGLTRRQMQVLRLLDEGRSNNEIARTLFVSTKTVDHHVSDILGKLNARSRGEAAAIARSSGLIGG